MTIETNVTVTGLKELEKKLLRDVPAKAQGRVMARALKRSARPLVRVAKSLAYRGDSSGALSLAITQWTERKSLTLKRGYFVTVYAGPKRNNKRVLARYYKFYKRRPTSAQISGGVRHGHLVEFGARGLPKHPFMAPALSSQGKAVIGRFGKILGEEIEKEAKKGVKQ